VTNRPTTPEARADLPRALTFFLTEAQRAAVLCALRRRDSDRSRALLRALRIETPVKGGRR
jgi:hypothetical protein